MSVFVVAIDGPDGSGKSTIAALLVNMLRDVFPKKIIKHTAVPTKEMITGILPLVLRNSRDEVTSEVYSLAYAADHLHHYNMFIKPLEDSKEEYIVVQERSIMSSIIYQSIIGGTDMTWLYEINKFDNNLPKINIILKLDPEELAERRQLVKKSEDKFETEEHVKKQMDLYYKLPREIREKFNVRLINAGYGPNHAVGEIIELIKLYLKGVLIQQQLE